MVARSWSSPVSLRMALLVVRILVILGLLGACFQINLPRVVQAAPHAGLLQTLGDFLSLGANTMRELQKAISMAGAEMRSVLQALYNDINLIMDKLEEKFRDNLNITLTSLDDETHNLLVQLEGTIHTVNNLLQDDIRLVSQEAQDTIRLAAREINLAVANLEQTLKRSALILGITGAYLIDVATNNIIFVLAIVLLGAGLLLFIALLFTHKMPTGFSRTLLFIFMGLFFALCIAMLVPPVRVSAMAFAGLGLKAQLDPLSSDPHIIDVVPGKIVLGQTAELAVWGSLLMPGGQTPQARIAGVSVPVKAAAENQVVLNTASLNVSDSQLGSQQLVLIYNGQEGPKDIVTLVKPQANTSPADLQISSFTLTPTQPIKDQPAQGKIQVCNRGGTLAASFVVRWKPIATMAGQTQRINVDVNQCFTVAFTHTFTDTGSFTSQAIVDAYGDIQESNETNNTQSLGFTVIPATTQPVITRTPRSTGGCPSNKPKCCEPGEGKCALCIGQGQYCP